MRFLGLLGEEWKRLNGARVNSGSVLDIQYTIQVVYRVESQVVNGR